MPAISTTNRSTFLVTLLAAVFLATPIIPRPAIASPPQLDEQTRHAEQIASKRKRVESTIQQTSTPSSFPLLQISCSCIQTPLCETTTGRRFADVAHQPSNNLIISTLPVLDQVCPICPQVINHESPPHFTNSLDTLSITCPLNLDTVQGLKITSSRNRFSIRIKNHMRTTRRASCG
jgi:hypothetical protein